MDEFSSNSSQQHNTDIKQEIVDQIKNEFDSSSQDSIASRNSGNNYPRWAPNLTDGMRKSAFLPYKPVQCTVLTNLQRGESLKKCSFV